MAVKLPLILCVLAIWAFDFGYSTSHHTAAPDCSGLILKMADCLSFVSSGSTVSKPTGSCCSGLETVVQSNPACLCEIFKNSGQFSIPLNMTKAITLPAACQLSVPSLSKCGLSPSPSPSPSGSPGSSSPPLSPTSGGGASSAPAPASEKALSPSAANSVSFMGFFAAVFLVGQLLNFFLDF